MSVFFIIVGWMEVDYQVNCCGCFFLPLHTISESGLDWVAEEWRVVAVGNNNNKRIGERKAPLSTVMQLHNEDMIYVGGHNEMGSSHAYICIPAPQLQDYIRSG